MLVALAKSFSQPHRPHPPALLVSRVSQHPSWLPSLPQSVNHANKLVMNIMCVGVGRAREWQGVLSLRMFGTHSQCEMARPPTRFPVLSAGRKHLPLHEG